MLKYPVRKVKRNTTNSLGTHLTVERLVKKYKKYL